jgi:hypothetical protein
MSAHHSTAGDERGQPTRRTSHEALDPHWARYQDLKVSTGGGFLLRLTQLPLPVFGGPLRLSKHQGAAMEDGSKWVGTLMLLVIIGIAGWPLVERMRNEITVYKFCTDGRVNGVCNSKEEQTANPTTYKAFPDLQSVVYWTGDGPPSRFTSCAVRDVSNWTCHYGRAGESGRVEYTMTDGNYSEYAEAPMFASTTLFYPVSRWRWWMV